MRHNTLVFLGVLGVVGVFFAAKWMLDGALFMGDMVSFEGPLEHLMGRWQQRGEVPLWVPEIHGGYPLLANGNISFWYLLHVVLRSFLSGPWVVNASLLLHALLGAGGMYAWMRYNRLPAMAAACAGLLFVFGGAMGARLALSNFYTAMAWIPLLALLLQKFIISQRQSALFYWVLVATLHVLSGNPQAVAIGLVVQAVLAAVFLWRWSIRPLLFLGGAGVLVILLTSVHTLPLLFHLPYTERAEGIARAELLEFSFPWQAWQGLFIPHPYGHGETYDGPKGEAEIAAYLGPVALLLALVGITTRSLPGFLRFFVVGLIGLGVVLSLGEQSVVYRWLILYTPLKFFATPARYFLFAHIGLVIAAAGGVAFMVRYLTGRWSFLGRLALTCAMVLPVLWVAGTWERGVPWSELVEPVLVESLRQEPGRLVSFQGLIDEAPDNNFGITAWQGLSQGVVVRQTFQSPFENISTLRLRFSLPSGRDRAPVTVTLKDSVGSVLTTTDVPAASLVDSEWTTLSLPPLAGMKEASLVLELSSPAPRHQAPIIYIHTNPGKMQYDPTGTLSVCQARCEELQVGETGADLAFSVLPTDTLLRPAHQLLGPNVAAGYGIQSAEWTGSMGVREAAAYHKAMGENQEALTGGRGLLNRLAVTQVVTASSPHRELSEDFGLVKRTQKIAGPLILQTYRNTQAFPRIHYVDSVQAVSPEEQLAVVRNFSPTNPASVVADVASDMSFPAEGTFTVVADRPRELIVRTEREATGFLVVRDLWYPGWWVTIDGQQMLLMRVDSIFRGVTVPAGSHEVRFTYKPEWTTPVVALTVFGAAGLLVWGAVLSYDRFAWLQRFRLSFLVTTRRKP